jgi:hypothetical protein
MINTVRKDHMANKKSKGFAGIINHDRVEEVMSNPNTAAIMCGMLLKSGPLASLNKITLTGDYGTDFKTAYAHPEHDNEALVYSDEWDRWGILDCCGDYTGFGSLSEALTEFLSPVGHLMWVEAKEYGQHRPAGYFMS